MINGRIEKTPHDLAGLNDFDRLGASKVVIGRYSATATK